MTIFLIPLALAVFAPAPACACRPVAGDRILARDLAAAIPAFASLDRETFISLAPLPGARRIFRPAELARLATRHHLSAGADISGICFERTPEPVDPTRLAGALRAAVPGVELDLLDFSRYPVPDGVFEFSRGGLSIPPLAGPDTAVLWRGRLRDQSSGRTVMLWAKVKLSIEQSWVIASEDLTVGQVIRAEKVRIEVARRFPFGSDTVSAIGDVAGLAPRRAIRKGQPVPAALLMRPADVHAGQMVDVKVESGGAQIKLDARAETSGRTGEKVLLRNLASGRRFQGIVSGPGTAMVASWDGKGQ